MNNKEIQEIKETFKPGNQEIEGWTNLRLYFGEYSKEIGPILCVGIQSTLFARETVYFLETDLTFKKNKVKEMLSKKGVVDTIVFKKIEDMVAELKKAEEYERVESIDQLLNMSTVINEEENEEKIMSYYKILVEEALLVEQESFETSKWIKGIEIQRGGKRDSNSRKKEYGGDVILVSSEQLIDVLDIHNEKKIVNIVKAWMKKDLLITDSSPSLTRRISWGNKTRSRGYVIKLKQGGDR